jgi:hypothetical protein
MLSVMQPEERLGALPPLISHLMLELAEKVRFKALQIYQLLRDFGAETTTGGINNDGKGVIMVGYNRARFLQT